MHTKYLFWTLALALIIFLFGAKVLLQLHDGLSIVSTRSGHKYTWDPPESEKLFFLIIFRGHQSFLWGHRYPCFRLLVISALSFKVRLDCLACTLRHLCAMESSDSPLVQHLLISGWPAWRRSHSHPPTCKQALVGLETGITV